MPPKLAMELTFVQDPEAHSPTTACRTGSPVRPSRTVPVTQNGRTLGGDPEVPLGVGRTGSTSGGTRTMAPAVAFNQVQSVTKPG